MSQAGLGHNKMGARKEQARENDDEESPVVMPHGLSSCVPAKRSSRLAMTLYLAPKVTMIQLIINPVIINRRDRDLQRPPQAKFRTIPLPKGYPNTVDRDSAKRSAAVFLYDGP